MSNVFWAWRCCGHVAISIGNPFPIVDDEVPWCDRLHIPAEEFKHIFGTVPADGQAMQIDPSDYPAHCPVCDAMYLYDGEEHHMTCRCLPEPSAKAIYHALVLAVKTLEEK